MTKRVVLITGASSGIGRACALHLHERGFCVYGTSRRAGDPSLPYPMLRLDLEEADSAAPVVEQILGREGRIDAVINNAGMGIAGPAECTPITEIRRQMEVNFFGAVMLCQAALPAMRSQKNGYIVNIGSIAGVIAVPYQAIYSASKFALEGFSEALRLEVQRLGVRVAVIEPGDHKTSFTRNRNCIEITNQAEAYRDSCSQALRQMEHDEQCGPDPKKVAQLVHRILHLKNPHLRYTVGPPSERAAVYMHRFLPNSLMEQVMRKHYHIDCG